MSPIPPCRRCGLSVQEGWHYCPRCRAPLAADDDNWDDLVRKRDLARQGERERQGEVKWDTTLLGIGLVILGVLGAVAGSMAIFDSNLRGFSFPKFFIIGIGLITMMTVGVVLMARGKGGRGSTSRGAAAAGGLMSGLAIGCLGAGLAVMAVFSAVIFALQDCLKACGGGR